jgi:hypothetical protein
VFLLNRPSSAKRGEKNGGQTFPILFQVTIESAAQKAANKTAKAILSGKYNKKLREGNIDDVIEVN